MDFLEQKWVKQTDKCWGLNYGIINRAHQVYVSPQEQTDCPGCVQLYLPRTRAQRPLFQRDKDAARQDIPSSERENL